MTATDELRRLLDERGAEYDVDDTPVDGNGTMYRVTYVKEGYARTWVYEEPPDCSLLVSYNHDLGAEDAIAATLGAGTCRNTSKVTDAHGQARFVCSECRAWIDLRVLWNPDYPNGESPWVRDCKLNYCPNCGARVEDE